VIALYLWLLDMDPWANAAVTLALGLLTFTDAKFLHPFRVRTLMTINLAVTGVWLLASVALVVLHPDRPGWAFVPWLLASAYYAVICAWRTLRGTR
jgi:phosphatidylcholine synthase